MLKDLEILQFIKDCANIEQQMIDALKIFGLNNKEVIEHRIKRDAYDELYDKLLMIINQKLDELEE